MKPIKAWVFDPVNSIFKQKASEKARGHIIYCKYPERCELYARGQCIAVSSYCPYSKKEVKIGPTKRAKGYFDWLHQFREEYKDVINTKLISPEKMQYFIDLVYIPMSYLGLNENINFICGGGCFSSDIPIIKRSDFDAELIKEEILKFRPIAMINGYITEYQEKEIPKFLKWLKDIDKRLFEEVKGLIPDYFTSISDIGRKAILQTLNPNVGVFKDIHGGVWKWDGEYLYSNNSHGSFMIIEAKETEECRLKPKGSVVVVVNDELQINDNTEFIN